MKVTNMVVILLLYDTVTLVQSCKCYLHDKTRCLTERMTIMVVAQGAAKVHMFIAKYHTFTA